MNDVRAWLRDGVKGYSPCVASVLDTLDPFIIGPSPVLSHVSDTPGRRRF